MKLAIYARTVAAHYRSGIYVGLGLAAMSLMFATLFGDMQDQIGEFVNVVPAGMDAFIGDLASATSPEGWLGIELFALFFPFAVSILAIVYGAGLIGREEESGTLELLLATSLSRRRILTEKFLALVSLVAVPALVLWGGVMLGSLLFDFDPDIGHVLAACMAGALLGLVYGTLSFAVQTSTGRRVLGSGIGAGLLGVTYTVTILSRLLDSWKDYDVLSPFHYYDNPATLIDGAQVTNLIVLAAIVATFSIVAWIGFERRDIGV